MFTRRTRTEVLTSHEDAALILGVVENKILNHATVFPIAPVTKQVVAKELLLFGGCLEEACRDNLVGVHILQWQGHARRCYDVKFLFHNSVLGSVITPVTAAAAATNGDARMVREPGP